ncbi:MAG: c-type cytochrome [Campylobacterota bacterium]|nr:c-type cytochrome [Campylobacterota bacterium]
MFKIILIQIIFISVLCAKNPSNETSTYEDSFITKFEYGKMLYKNPRGISCSKCHGEDAKGKNISTFTHIKNDKEYKCSIHSSDITDVTYDLFLATLDPKLEKPKRKFHKGDLCGKLTYGNSMPTYFLTKEELSAIHYYLINKEKYE